MKKSTALLFFGSQSLMIAGYLCWSARPFYIRPGVEFAPDVPVSARNAVNSWVKDSGGYGPEAFNVWRFIRLLAHPYERAVIPASVTFLVTDPYAPGPGMRIAHPHKPYLVRFRTNNNHKWLEPTFH